jgi:hypothetical protein
MQISVNVSHFRTGSVSRSGGTATKISLAPMSMPAAFGSNRGCSTGLLRPALLLRAFVGPDLLAADSRWFNFDVVSPIVRANGPSRAQKRYSFDRNQSG